MDDLVASRPGDARSLALRMFMAMLATQEVLSVYIGARLGLYDDLAESGPATAPELAARAGIAHRYAREWLEQQAVAGFLAVEAPDVPPNERVYLLPAAHAEVLRVSDSPLSMLALTVLPVGGIARALPRLLEAYRGGGGVADAEFGEDWRDGHSGTNRALFAHMLPGWVRRYLPDVHARLAAGSARIADVGCGAGWAAIALANAYPGSTVDGFDLDPEMLERARANAEAAALSGRVTFRHGDAAARLPGSYELVCLFDALHEMTDPAGVLRTCRRLAAGGGCVLVLDAKVADRFTAPGDELERFQYATSTLHCLPVALDAPGASGTGTVLRVETVRELAGVAGFDRVDVIPVDDRFHRLYRLVDAAPVAAGDGRETAGG